MSQQQGHSTAAARVYGNSELLDIILHHVDQSSFLRAQRVHKQHGELKLPYSTHVCRMSGPLGYKGGPRASTCLDLDCKKLKQIPAERLDDCVTQPPWIPLFSIPQEGSDADWVAIKWIRRVDGVRLRDLLVRHHTWPDGIHGLRVELWHVAWKKDDVLRHAECIEAGRR